MIEFLDQTADTSTAISGAYVWRLVALSYTVAAFALYTGLSLSERMKFAANRKAWSAWHIASSVIIGIGAWAMHFIGMLAFALPIPVAYDLTITVVSVVPAIIGCSVAVYVMETGEWSHRRYTIAGTVMGLGIGAMHYTGMSAMKVAAVMRYDPLLFALSIVVAVGLGIAAMYIHGLTHRPTVSERSWLDPLDAALMALAITGMHYTAMFATYFFPDAMPGIEQNALDLFWLSVAVAVGAALIIVLAFIAAIVGERWQAANHLAMLSRRQITEGLNSISDGFALFDSNGVMLMCNQVVRELYPALDEVFRPGVPYERLLRAWAGLSAQFPGGLSTEQYVDEALRRFDGHQDPGGYSNEEQLADGRWIYFRQHSIPSGGIACIWTDITSYKELQNLYKELAHHDSLTGLPNRKLFDDRIDHAAAHARRRKG